jgi:hypothetical protein
MIAERIYGEGAFHPQPLCSMAALDVQFNWPNGLGWVGGVSSTL